MKLTQEQRELVIHALRTQAAKHTVHGGDGFFTELLELANSFEIATEIELVGVTED